MYKLILCTLTAIFFFACSSNRQDSSSAPENDAKYNYVIDRFADIEILRYTVDQWEQLSFKQKELIYYLSEAALCGRDIIYDQNCRYNLTVKHVLDNIIIHHNSDDNSEEWAHFMTYAKRFWFSNGMHHHYANSKFFPEISEEYFASLMDRYADTSALPLLENESPAEFKKRVINIIFNPKIAPVKTSHDISGDIVKNSSVNFYEGVTREEVETFYTHLQKKDSKADPNRPVSYGLNSKVVKNEKGSIIEIPYKIGGMYSEAIKMIVYWLEKAANVAENPLQQAHIEKLIEYYKTGDLKIWDEYNILWVQDIDSHVDYVNGFVEVYSDPLGRKGAWEALVNFKDEEHSSRATIISQNAQWFEDHSPIDSLFKRKEVKGVEAKVIIAAQLGGDTYPATAIGINLPNANWIRQEYGSKSVTIHNIMYAYAQARLQSGLNYEFYNSEYETGLLEKYGFISDNLQVDLHECLGHGSGQLLPGIGEGSLRNFHSVIEETRADLFSLYFIADPKMVELGLLPNEEAHYACYYKYIINGLMLQLNRIEPGNVITEAHMRNRAIIANWCYEQGQEENVIDLIKRDHKTHVVINDYDKLRELFATLLKEVQRIKSTGDYAAAKKLVEKYGIEVDPVLHSEVKERYALLDLAPYSGFVNPVYTPLMEDGKITDILIEYPDNYVQQMQYYNQKYSFLK